MAVNLDSVFLGTKHCISLLQQTKDNSIVNISSAYGLVGNLRSAAYCASKGGVRLFTKATAIEYADLPSPVRINCICPGVVETPMWEKSSWWEDFVRDKGSIENAWNTLAKEKSLLNKNASADEVAKAIVFLASDQARFMTGTDFLIDGGYTAA